MVIFTTREVDGVWAWLRKNNLDGLVDDVTNVKIPAFAYVDDRAICFRGNYSRALRQIELFHPYWRPRDADCKAAERVNQVSSP